MTNLEVELASALREMLGISHRINGCSDKECGVCRENKSVISAANEALKDYDDARHEGV